MKNTLCKSERLSSKVIIDDLFSSKGVIKIKEFPFILITKETELPTDFPVQAMFSVAKRKNKLAVTRNLIKRRIKEGYRKNKTELYSVLQKNNKQLAICFIYLDNKPLPYQVIEEKIIVLLERLTQKSE